MQPITIRTEDGYRLQGHHFAPVESRGITVVINAAIFVRQRFYFSFARWLASQGIHAVTFSNRGMGQSLTSEDRTWHHELRHWGERDLPAVMAWARRARPDDRLFLVGHSMGGQLAAMTDHVHDLDGIVTVASCSAYWHLWPRPQRYGILAWYGTAAILGRVLPYFPAAHVNVGPNVASTLVRDWVRWGRHRDYLYGPFGMRPTMADYQGRVLSWSFTDDQLGILPAVEALHHHYTQAQLSRRHVHPSEIGATSIGHFKWFREATGRPLWEQTVDWMG